MPDLGCPPNAAVAFDYLIGKGLSREQAAGVVGNLQGESGLNPHNDAPDPTRTDPSARGRGIASWGPPRWQNLLTFAAGRDPWAFDTQIAFLWHELESDPSLGLAPLLATTNVADATIVFQNRFERPDPARAHTDRRIQFANAAFFACPYVTPPLFTSRAGIVAAAVGVIALVSAASYGIFKALGARKPKPEPEPMPRPIFPPSPIPRRFAPPPTVFRRVP